MGYRTSTAAFVAFLLIELAQGVILTYFLRRETGDLNMYLWLIADGILLILWLLLLLHRRKIHLSVDMPLVQIPTIAFAWLAYLCIVLIPRISWLMGMARNCLGYQAQDLTDLENEFTGGILNKFSWGPNTLVTVLAVGSTTLLVCLVVAGYGQHGLLSAKNPLDFDMAEAAFCLIDGVEFLLAFFEVERYDTCRESEAASNVTTSLNVNTTLMENSYITALNGSLGNIIIALTLTCFTLPFMALWLFKLRSNVLKAEVELNDERGKLETATSVDAPVMVPAANDRTNQNGVSQPQDYMASSSEFKLDMEVYKGNLTTTKRFQGAIFVIKLVYIMWDIFLINLPGAIVRILLWVKYGRPISALITKNILSVVFRSLNIFIDYLQPCYSSRMAEADHTAAKGRQAPTANGATTHAKVSVTIPAAPVPLDDV